MPPFRFHIPFFSYGSPSRLSSGTSSPSPPPTPPPSRPPFRPAGIAQPSKQATSSETKPKVPPTLSRAKSNVAAIAAASSSAVSQPPSRGAVTPTRLAKQSNQSGSTSKSPKAEEQKVATKEKPPRGTEKEAGENINRVIEKPPISRSERKEAEEVQEQSKKTQVEKLAVEEKKKVLHKDMGENSKTAQEQVKKKETEKPAVGERNSKTDQEQQKSKETEKLALEEKEKVLRKDIMEQNSKTAQEQQKIKETEELSVEEKKKVLRKDMEENSKTAQEQHKRQETEKLDVEERNRALQTVGKEDATRSKTTRHIAAGSESSRGPRDLPERKTQNRTEIHADDNRQKSKVISTGDHGKEGSSSMSRRIKEDIRDGISKLTWGKSNGDEKSVSVFTLTGENRGATMSINSEKDKKDGEVHIHRGYRSNPDESPNTTATETEGERRPFNGKDEEEEARLKAYVNGNTQGINNSIVCDSSVQENDPGIHMSMKVEESKKKDETISPPENVSEKKPETVTTTTTAKLGNEPRVRRRCLRGLLAESSESEPENPLKPRRHGCRFTCKDKDIENT